MEAGVRELRDRLSHYLNIVRDGQEVTVTGHGLAVVCDGHLLAVAHDVQVVTQTIS